MRQIIQSQVSTFNWIDECFIDGDISPKETLRWFQRRHTKKKFRVVLEVIV